MKSFFYYSILTLTSAILAWLGYSYHWFWPLMLFFLIPLLHIIYRRDLKYWQLFIVGGTFGILAALAMLFWHWDVLPLDWAGVTDKKVSVALVFYAWMVTSSLGMVIGVWAILYKWLKKDNLFDLILAPASWVALEFLRSWAITLFWYGEGALVGPHWSIAFVGYAFGSSSLFLPLAAWGGIYLLGFVCILINILIYFTALAYIEKMNWQLYSKLTLALLIVVSVFAGAFYAWPEKKVDTKQVAIANTYRPSFSNIQPAQAIKNLEDILKLLGTIRNEGHAPDIIILPEDSRVIGSLQSLGVQEAIKSIAGTKETLIIDSARIIDPSYKVPTLKFFFLNTKTGHLDRSDKIFLTPHGEYIPYITAKLLEITGNGRWVETFKGLRQVSRGKEIKLTHFQGVQLGAVACLEVLSSEVNSRLTKQGTAFLVNTASHALFNGSNYLYSQIVNMSKVRAVENNRYYVQSSNYVPSFVLDNKGRMLQESPWGINNMLYSDVKIIESHSIYNLFGRSVLALFIFIVLAWTTLQKLNLWPPRLKNK